jgi:DNA-binding NarL/FixJ family response regulator
MLDLREAPQPACLTDEELQVAALVGQGYWGSQIANQLSIEECHVAERLSGAMAKLGIQGRLDLWMYAKLRIPLAVS